MAPHSGYFLLNSKGLLQMNKFLNNLILGDCIEQMKELPDSSIHAIISDIPYGIGAEDWDVLHKNNNSAYLGTSPAQKKAQANFAKRGKPINGWSEADRRISHEYQEWCSSWAKEWNRVLVPGGSALVFAGRRFEHRCINALEDNGFSLKDQLAWIKPKAPHRAQRLSVVYERRGDIKAANDWNGWRLGNLRPRFEPIIWAVKPYKVGTTIADNALNYGVGAYNPQAVFQGGSEDSSNILEVGSNRSEPKIHPTQKPLKLMQILVELVTRPGQIILDPFAGSGSTLVAAQSIGRAYIGFELNPEYHRLALERLKTVQETLI